MRYFDRAFALTVEFFAIGVVSGALVTMALPVLREMGSCTRAVQVVGTCACGDLALSLLIFLNNFIPIALSFAYPFTDSEDRLVPTAFRPKARNPFRRVHGSHSISVGVLLGWNASDRFLVDSRL